MLAAGKIVAGLVAFLFAFAAPASAQTPRMPVYVYPPVAGGEGAGRLVGAEEGAAFHEAVRRRLAGSSRFSLAGEPENGAAQVMATVLVHPRFPGGVVYSFVLTRTSQIPNQYLFFTATTDIHTARSEATVDDIVAALTEVADYWVSVGAPSPDRLRRDGWPAAAAAAAAR